MGRKIDALLGRRTFKTYKFKPVVSLAFSRLTVLKNQRQARMSVARSDVVELLKLGHQERALNRVEQVIKEQNMLDVFVLVEGYCHLFVERLDLIDKEKGCPEELEEAVSSLIYASTRCGEFPELQEMRAMFTSRFGKEFVARGAELRNNCKVNTKMVVKLSTRQPNLESRMKVLKAIASENGISLQIEEEYSLTTEKSFDAGSNLEENSSISLNEEKVESFSDSMKGRKKYKDVADAAQAAFESAAYAAAAARAAVELSRSGSYDPDDQNSPGSWSKKVSDSPEPRVPYGRGLDREESEISNTYRSVHEDEEMQMANNDEGSKTKKIAKLSKKSFSNSSPYDSDHIPQGTEFTTNTEAESKAFPNEVVFDGSDDDDDGTEQRAISLTRIHDNDGDTLDGSDLEPTIFHKQYRMTSQASPEWEPVPVNLKINYDEKPKAERSLRLNLDNRPISMRTRRVYRQ